MDGDLMKEIIKAPASPKSDAMSIKSINTPDRQNSDCSSDFDHTILTESILSEVSTSSIESDNCHSRSPSNRQSVLPASSDDNPGPLQISVPDPVSHLDLDIAQEHIATTPTSSIAETILATASMSGQYYYNPSAQDDEEQEYVAPYQVSYPAYTTAAQVNMASGYTISPQMLQRPVQQRYAVNPQQTVRSPYQYTTAGAAAPSAPAGWTTVPSSYVQQPPMPIAMYGSTGYPAQTTSYYPPYLDSMATTPSMNYSQAPPTLSTASYLSPPPVVAGPSRPRPQRAASIASSVSYNTDNSRSASPNAMEMARWGIRLPSDGGWKCSYPGCTSSSVFSRGCDLRKHYKRHTKTLFCSYPDCPQSTRGGFSSKKDRARHEAKHAPSIHCEWEGCDKVFSRVDNMKDHVKRVHRKRAGGS